jgi:hypothetical protein
MKRFAGWVVRASGCCFASPGNRFPLTPWVPSAIYGSGPLKVAKCSSALGYEVADLFMDFPDRAREESLIALVMTANQADLPRGKYAGNIEIARAYR